LELPHDAFVFSLSADGSTPLVPHSVSQRYTRLLTRLKVDGKFHGLRHYSATELIAAGVDLRTVAGRLGHGGGGATTLKVYAAWLARSVPCARGGHMRGIRLAVLVASFVVAALLRAPAVLAVTPVTFTGPTNFAVGPAGEEK